MAPVNNSKKRQHTIAISAVLLIAVCIQSSLSLAADKIKVSYLSPSLSRPFWVTTMELLQAAAEDLDIELNVVIAERSTYKQHKAGKAALNASEKPDYFITGLWLDVTDRLLRIAEEKEIKSLIFNGTLTRENQEYFGLPRGELRHWIGLLYPDDQGSSYRLARLLLEETRQGTPAQKTTDIEVLGLGGDPQSAPSRFRSHGLRRAIRESSDAELVDFLHCEWRETVARDAAEEFLQQYPESRTIWAASDSMAMGALRAIKEAGKKPGQDIFVGGFDWSPEALQEIKKGNMVASVGGHIAEATWALILIHDYHHGIDFFSDPGILHKTEMNLITRENVDHYLELLNDPDWSQIDFKQFSKVHNKQLTQYNFNFEAIAEQLRKTDQ